MENTINLKIEGNTQELVIRTGEAEEIKYPVKEIYAGTIDAPRTFAEIRTMNKMVAVVLYSKSKRYIKYKEIASNQYGSEVTGHVELNPDLHGFGINRDTKWSPKTLAAFLKMNRAHFRDREDCVKLVTQLMNLKANTILDNNQAYDNRGNVKNDKEKIVTVNVEMMFVLKMPILIGGDTKEFMVEVCLDTTDSGVILWLESVELAEILKTATDELIDAEVKWFRDEGIVCIEE